MSACKGCKCQCGSLMVRYDPDARYPLLAWQWVETERAWQPRRVNEPTELKCASCKQGPGEYRRKNG